MKEDAVAADLHGFLTPDPNTTMGAIHPKAMPVILTAREEREIWLNAPWEDAAVL